jgi:signal peptidase I
MANDPVPAPSSPPPPADAPPSPVTPAARRGLWGRLFGSGKSTKPGQPPPPPTDAVREILETVVFVIVLVLLLKSFAAEAFVIPTGSMAESLWGYQKVVDCPSCGYQFPVNCSSEVDPQQDAPPVAVTGCTCPNCRLHIAFKTDLREPRAVLRGDGSLESVEIGDPGWSSGDRVLVAKFIYDLFGSLPNRLDVVVFKYPGGGNEPRETMSRRELDELWPASGPHKNHVPLNYIKRLIGLPGETIAICNGKIYILSPEKGLKYDDLKDAKGAPLTGEALKERLQTLWRKPYMHINDPEAIERFRKGQFEILRKPPEVMLVTRRIVYDNDHPGFEDLARKEPLPPRWVGDVGWRADGAAFRGDGAGGRFWLTYRHLLRGSQEPELIKDFMGYNTNEPSQGGSNASNWVGDLMLEAEVAVEKAEGELTLELRKGADRFQAVFDLANGFCTLNRISKEDKDEKSETVVKLATKATALKGAGTHHVRFADFDEQLTLWVDGGLPFGGGVVERDPPRPPQKTSEGEADKQPVKVGVKDGVVTLRKVKLWRDTYYTHMSPPSPQGEPPVQTYYVQPGHFLCLGDNSPQSSDGRAWGLVPERLLLGRAVLVYYPFYCPLWPLSSRVNRVGMIR